MKQIDDKDINNLNYRSTYTEEEKRKVQKKFFFLLMIFIILIIVSVIFFIYEKDIRERFSKKETPKVIEEEKVLTLKEMNDGEITLSNEELMMLFEIFFYNPNDHFITNTTKIYINGFEKLTNEEKLFYISKTNDFYIAITGEDYITRDVLCSEPITITKDRMETIAKENFNINNLNHSNFWTTYSYENTFYSYLYFEFKNGKYEGVCRDIEKNPLTIVPSNIIDKAEKKGDYIFIYMQTIFETKDGVYKDVNLKELITNNYDEDKLLSYYQQGSTYRLEFKYNGKDDYYFEKMTLINK